MSETATINSNEIAVRPSVHLGTRRLTADCPNGWEDVKKLTKKVLTHDGRKYKFIGWNSDRNEVFFIESPDFATIGTK